MTELIELSPENYNKHLPLDLIAFSYASGGAMGEGGAIILVSKTGMAYHLNYIYDEWKYDIINTLCPVLEQCDIGIFGEDNAPEGWTPFNLGMGNHLFFRSEIEKEFMILLEKKQMHPYRAWLGIVLEIVQKTPKD